MNTNSVSEAKNSLSQQLVDINIQSNQERQECEEILKNVNEFAQAIDQIKNDALKISLLFIRIWPRNDDEDVEAEKKQLLNEFTQQLEQIRKFEKIVKTHQELSIKVQQRLDELKN